jgi:hypothetical protein
MQFFKMLVLSVSLVAFTGCAGFFNAPKYGVPITAGGGVGYSSTVIQTVLVVNKSEYEVFIQFPQFTSMNVEPFETARKNLRVTTRMDVAYSVTYRKGGRPIKVYSDYVTLEPIFDPYSGGRGYQSPTPKIEIPALLREYLD